MIRLERYATAADFLAVAESFLLEAEAENALILGIARGLVDGTGDRPVVPAYFAAIRDPERVVLCAFRTLPDKLGLTRSASPDALAVLAEDVETACPGVETVVGPEPTVGAFAELFAVRTRRRAEPRMSQRIHELRSVAALGQLAPGRLRPAHLNDLDLLTDWTTRFLTEVGEPGDGRELAAARIAAQQLFVWDDDGPVSMAAWTGKTPNGVRVNLVYTPDPLRRRGYATACVATLSQLLLRHGNRFCCLYTDLANPTSNAIYQRIGYRPVCDAGLYGLTDPRER